jgi:hypothetical protein
MFYVSIKFTTKYCMLENTEVTITNGQSRDTRIGFTRHKMKTSKITTQHNMCLTPLYVNTHK